MLGRKVDQAYEEGEKGRKKIKDYQNALLNGGRRKESELLATCRKLVCLF